MSEQPLQPGDLLQDIHGEDCVLLLRKNSVYDSSGGGYHIDTWEFWNLTSDSPSWWYAASLENEDEFRRI